jgi:signal transduction histidine kinase
MLEEARSNWTREKAAARAGERAQEHVELLQRGVRELRDALRARSAPERRVEQALGVVERIESDAARFRAELSAMNSSLEMVELFVLAREVFDTWAPGLRAAGVEVTERVPAGGPALLMHRASVRTALDSILRVLSAHVAKGDRVLLECSATAGKAVLLIADTAGKIDGTLLSRLFMPFTAGADEDDPDSAIAAAGDILQRHAGEITVKSSPSWKTILAVSFPVSSNRDRRHTRRDRRRRPRDRRQPA